LITLTVLHCSKRGVAPRLAASGLSDAAL